VRKGALNLIIASRKNRSAEGQPGKLLYLKGFALTADSETDKLASQIAGVGVVEREPANDVTHVARP
jgi:hypothetical protein